MRRLLLLLLIRTFSSRLVLVESVAVRSVLAIEAGVASGVVVALVLSIVTLVGVAERPVAVLGVLVTIRVRSFVDDGLLGLAAAATGFLLCVVRLFLIHLVGSSSNFSCKESCETTSITR